MRVFLDDKPCDIQADNVGEAIAQCAAMAEDDGRYVVEVVVDGDQWNNEKLDSSESRAVVADELRLSTAEPAALVGQTFADAASALNDARTMQDDAAALLQRDDQPAAMTQLGEAFTIWMSVQQAVVQGSQLVNLDLDQHSVDGRPVQEIIGELNERLQSLRDQLESNDTVGVADTLLYEMPDVIHQWRAMLEELQQIVQEA